MGRVSLVGMRRGIRWLIVGVLSSQTGCATATLLSQSKDPCLGPVDEECAAAWGGVAAIELFIYGLSAAAVGAAKNAPAANAPPTPTTADSPCQLDEPCWEPRADTAPVEGDYPSWP
jgi:hypothetical protein